MRRSPKLFLTRFYRDLSLPRKVLLPFFLILVLLGAGATVGAILLLKEAKFKRVDEQLHTFYEAVQQEIAGHQEMLKVIAGLLAKNERDIPLESFHNRLPLFSSSASDDPLKLEIRFIPIDDLDKALGPAMLATLTDAIVNEAPRNIILLVGDDQPTIATMAPTGPADAPTGAIVTHVDISNAYLERLPKPDKGSIHLLSETGESLSTSQDHVRLQPLKREEIQRILKGSLLIETQSPPFGQRVLYGSIPLVGSHLILAVAFPLDDLRSLVTTVAVRSTLTIIGALILGGLLYTIIIRSIMAPIKELLEVTEAIARGELNHRIGFSGGDEFGRLARSFNHMLRQMGHLYDERLDHQKRLAVAAEELRHKEDIEKKNAEVARANRDLRTSVRELTALIQCNQAMISTLDLSLLFDRILTVLQEVLDCNDLVLLLYNEENSNLAVRKVLGLDPALFNDISFNLEEGITGCAARNKKPVYVEDLEKDGRNLCYKGRVRISGSLLCVPMVIRGRLVGVLNLHKNVPHGFSDSEINLAQAIANQAAIAIENAQLYEQTRSLSITDELTGLANRRHFQEMLEREKKHVDRFKGHFSIVMLDIDHFKSYNDSHGHISGDAALRIVADLLLENTRGVDLAARYGGEEFILLLSQTDVEGAVQAAEKIRHAVESTPFAGEEKSQPGGAVTLSLGVATYPNHAPVLEELIGLADQALYRAKLRGRNRVESAGGAQQPPPPSSDAFA